LVVLSKWDIKFNFQFFSLDHLKPRIFSAMPKNAYPVSSRRHQVVRIAKKSGLKTYPVLPLNLIPCRSIFLTVNLFLLIYLFLYLSSQLKSKNYYNMNFYRAKAIWKFLELLLKKL